MAVYLNDKFTNLINKSQIKTILELGGRYGDEAISLAEYYPEATIHTFECNPYVLPKARENLTNKSRITLHEVAVSDISSESIFYPADNNNPGASSLFVAKLGKWWGDLPPIAIKTKRLDEYFNENNIQSIDMICADIQGGELRAFEGMGKYLDNVKYIISEIPTNDATYFGAPTRNDVIQFLEKRGFSLVISSFGNSWEDDVMFVRLDK